MAGSDIVVGDKPSTRKSARRTVESMTERASAKTDKPFPAKPFPAKPFPDKPFPKPAPSERGPQKSDVLKPVGAMSQQRSDSRIHSVPQEFVHLVGCCDPKARPSKSGRLRRAPASQPRPNKPSK
jgi:hypothetical protein